MDYHGSNDDRQQADQIHVSYTATMKDFVLWLVDQGRQVRLFTTDVHDEPVMQGIVSEVRALRPEADPAQLVAEPVSSLDKLMRKIALVDTVVASRFHNVLSALKMGKPTLAVGYSKKFDALMTSMGVPEFCQSARSVELGRLIEQFTDLERRAPELTQTISERNADAERLVDGQFREMSVVLFGAAGLRADQDEPVRPRTDVRQEELQG
jgi:polysaccharide pyruvyl transferase WcaK-like protein